MVVAYGKIFIHISFNDFFFSDWMGQFAVVSGTKKEKSIIFPLFS